MMHYAAINSDNVGKIKLVEKSKFIMLCISLNLYFSFYLYDFMIDGNM